MRAWRYYPSGLALLAAFIAWQLAVRAQPQLPHVNLATPEAAPEKVLDNQDFPYLTRLGGTSLLKSERINEPLEVKPASADTDAMLAGLSFLQKSYSAPANVWDLAFITLYRDALALRGWRIVDEPPMAATENEPHVISLSAHYAQNHRDLYTRISRAPDGSYQISVADVGAEDWAGLLDRACHVPVFSLHFTHGAMLSEMDSNPSLEKIAALLRSKPALALEIQGHLDNAGDERELAGLSSKRAAVVSAALVGLGAPRERVTARGYGKSHPIEPNDTDWGRTKNRRIEIAKTDCKREGHEAHKHDGHEDHEAKSSG